MYIIRCIYTVSTSPTLYISGSASDWRNAIDLARPPYIEEQHVYWFVSMPSQVDGRTFGVKTSGLITMIIKKTEELVFHRHANKIKKSSISDSSLAS